MRPRRPTRRCSDVAQQGHCLLVAQRGRPGQLPESAGRPAKGHLLIRFVSSTLILLNLHYLLISAAAAPSPAALGAANSTLEINRARLLLWPPPTRPLAPTRALLTRRTVALLIIVYFIISAVLPASQLFQLGCSLISSLVCFCCQRASSAR